MTVFILRDCCKRFLCIVVWRKHAPYEIGYPVLYSTLIVLPLIPFLCFLIPSKEALLHQVSKRSIRQIVRSEKIISNLGRFQSTPLLECFPFDHSHFWNFRKKWQPCKVYQNFQSYYLAVNFRSIRLDCSQYFLVFLSIVERADRIARELDASAKRKTWLGSCNNLIFLSEFREFTVQRFSFGKYNNFWISGNFPRKSPYQLPPFRNFRNF